ncbi:hypothetical protein K443DRAFT_15559 [Laccaria amethystina LaAM-08-1]|uniref:Uncharacterized protein n=1 Tax=Laccaria amethystina LaAM-08-1 TaxID=1095629 RepID=A0A0C9WL78_9AGAR|nr:hypothetical protein K443DRAFT_15559 [Laccaria amethystina LaAM-08-1]
MSQAAHTPMPSVFTQIKKALSVQIMTESSRRITLSISSPEGSLTLCGTAQLMRLSLGVVLPEVSTPFLHIVDRPKRMGSIVDGNLSTMPTNRKRPRNVP